MAEKESYGNKVLGGGAKMENGNGWRGASPLDIEKPSVVDRTMEVGPLKKGPVAPSAPSPCTHTTIGA
nr:hypothetical protein CFP56_59763 [Quercus suber]